MKKITCIFLLMILSFSGHTQTLETNVPNIVIKNYQCTDAGKQLRGILVNRNTESFSGRIRVKIIDAENDILWQTTQSTSIGGLNGANFFTQIFVGNCLAPNKVQITLEL